MHVFLCFSAHWKWQTPKHDFVLEAYKPAASLSWSTLSTTCSARVSSSQQHRANLELLGNDKFWDMTWVCLHWHFFLWDVTIFHFAGFSPGTVRPPAGRNEELSWKCYMLWFKWMRLSFDNKCTEHRLSPTDFGDLHSISAHISNEIHFVLI